MASLEKGNKHGGNRTGDFLNLAYEIQLKSSLLFSRTCFTVFGHFHRSAFKQLVLRPTRDQRLSALSVWNTVCPLPESLQLERVCHPSAKLVCSQNRAGLCMCQQHQRSRTVYHQCLKFADVLAQMSAWICQLILHRRERKLMHQRKLALKIFYCRLFWQFLIAKLFWQLSQWNMTQTRIGFNKQGCKNPDLPSICLRYYLFSPSCVFTDQPSSVAVSKTHESLTAT